MKVSELMTREVRTCLVDEDLNRAAQIMWESDCGVVPVVDDRGRVAGVVTDRDVCMAAYTQGGSLLTLLVRDAMAKLVYTCSPEDTLEKAMSIMSKVRVRRLPVIDGSGMLVGIVSLNDLAREAARERPSTARTGDSQAVADTLSAIGETRRPAPSAKPSAKPAVVPPAPLVRTRP